MHFTFFFLNTYILYVPITFVQLFTFFLSPNDGLRNGGWWIGFLCSTVIGFPITWSGSVTYLTVCEISHAKFAFRLSLQLLSGHSFRSERSFNMCHDWWQFIRSDAALCSRLDFKIQLLPLCLSLVHKCRMYNSSHSVWWRSRPPGTVVTKELIKNKQKKKKKKRFESVNHKPPFRIKSRSPDCRCWLRDQQDPPQALAEKRKSNHRLPPSTQPLKICSVCVCSSWRGQKAKSIYARVFWAGGL